MCVSTNFLYVSGSISCYLADSLYSTDNKISRVANRFFQSIAGKLLLTGVCIFYISRIFRIDIIGRIKEYIPSSIRNFFKINSSVNNDDSNCRFPGHWLNDLELEIVELDEDDILAELNCNSKFSKLQKLKLVDCYIGQKGLKHIAALIDLRSLDLFGCMGISNLEPLKVLSQLESLKLTHCRGLSNIDALSFLSKLRELNFYGCDKLINLAPLAGLSHVMHGSQVLNTNPDYADRALPELQSLSLEKCNNLTDIDFKYIAALPKLQILKLRSCCRITDECLTYISDMNGLQNLDLRGCKRISAEALATFMANHPGVEIIR